MTEEHPDQLIGKKTILNDIFNRAAVSDFQPLKKQIESYREEELLLIYDIDFKFGQNFVICLSVSSKDSILAPPEEEEAATTAEEALGETPEGEEVLEVELTDRSATPPPRGPWVSQGSEKEIELWSVVPTRPILRHRFWRKRTKFNQPFFFSDRSSQDHKEMYTECEPSKEEAFSLSAIQMDRAVQAISPIEDTHSQTRYVSQLNLPIRHLYNPALSRSDIVTVHK